MKLTYKQKVQIYKEWKYKHKTFRELSLKYKIGKSNIRYMCQLAERWGIEKLKHTWTYYSPEFKKTAIDRVLIQHETIRRTSVDLGLPSNGMLVNWIREYIAEGYTVIERKKGRKPHGSEEAGGSSERERNSAQRECRASQSERDSYDTELILKKIRRLSCGKGKQEKEEIAQAVTELRHEVKRSVGFIIKAIASQPSLPQISRSTYYYWLNHQSPDEAKYSDLMKEIRTIYTKNKKRYGYRRIVLQLRNNGIHVNHKTVKRLMKKMDLYGLTPRAKYKSYKGDFHRTVPNKLMHKEVDTVNHTTKYIRDFKPETSNCIWTTDVSEFHIAAGKLYLSPILDLYDHSIVSYNISASPNFIQTTDMLSKAFAANNHLDGLIFHSDQGWQYQMAQYQQILKEHKIVQSMSRKGNCLDNCIMENFFGKMKNEMFYGHEYEFKSLDELKKAMEEYIAYYNTERIQVRLKGLTPCEARSQALKSN